MCPSPSDCNFVNENSIHHKDLVQDIDLDLVQKSKQPHTKVNIKYQGPKDMAPFHLLLIFENPNGFAM